jgi:hypothetical protein
MLTAYGLALASTLAPAEQSRTAFKRAQQLAEGVDDVDWRLRLLWCLWSQEMISGDYQTSLTPVDERGCAAQRRRRHEAHR